MYHHHFTPRTTKGRFEVVMAVIRDMVPCSLISRNEGGSRILWNRSLFMPDWKALHLRTEQDFKTLKKISLTCPPVTRY